LACFDITGEGFAVSTGLMAKTKKAGGAASKPEPARVRSAVLMIRGTPDWKAWVEELAEADRSPSLNELIDRALVAYARQVKFPKPAPNR
jgi:hypothetical protein